MKALFTGKTGKTGKFFREAGLAFPRHPVIAKDRRGS